jgi:TetR/AcrR family transcriptional regulator, regulator of cefoperazone and chloramphenicol sensitivity
MENQSDMVDTTKERLLAVAEKLFAEKGFNGVSVREITQCADCNLASVNYYFGNKQNLYYDVFRHRIVPQMTQVRSQFEDILAGEENLNFESIIRAVVTAFMEKHPLNTEDHETFHGLMHREIHNPTGAVDIIIGEAIGPFFQVLVDLFRPYLPKDNTDLNIKLKIFSLIALSLHFSHARTPVSRITGKEYDEAFVNELIDHTVSFALYGLTGNNGVKEEH